MHLMIKFFIKKISVLLLLVAFVTGFQCVDVFADSYHSDEGHSHATSLNDYHPDDADQDQNDCEEFDLEMTSANQNSQHFAQVVSFSGAFMVEENWLNSSDLTRGSPTELLPVNQALESLKTIQIIS